MVGGSVRGGDIIAAGMSGGQWGGDNTRGDAAGGGNAWEATDTGVDAATEWGGGGMGEKMGMVGVHTDQGKPG